MQLTNSLESLLLIIRHLTLNSIQDVTTSNLLGRKVKEKEEEKIERKGNEEGVGKRGEDEVEGTGSKLSVPKYKLLLLLWPYLGILIKDGPQLWEAPQSNDLVELGVIRTPLVCTGIMQLLCLLASLLCICWSLLTITLQCDITYKFSQHEILSVSIAERCLFVLKIF